MLGSKRERDEMDFRKIKMRISYAYMNRDEDWQQ